MENEFGKLPNEETPKDPVNPDNGGGKSDQVPPVNPEIDYQKKFSDSARENQVLRGQISDLEERLGRALNPESVSEAEIRQSYPDWDAMTDTERRLAKDNLSLQKTVKSALSFTSDVANKFSFSENFYKVINAKNPDGSLKYPGLRDNQERFREYCEMPTHKGVTLDVLARSFLFEVGEMPAPKKETPPAKPEMNRATPAGEDIKPQPISEEEAEKIRKSDPRRYNQLIKEGKIK